MMATTTHQCQHGDEAKPKKTQRHRLKLPSIVCFVILSSLVMFRQILQLKYYYNSFSTIPQLQPQDEQSFKQQGGGQESSTSSSTSAAAAAISRPLIAATFTTSGDDDRPATAAPKETNTTANTTAASAAATVISATMCSEEPLLEPSWEWHYYSKHGNSNDSNKSSSNNNSNHHRRRRHNLLIAQYSSFAGSGGGDNPNSYVQLIEKTAPINKEYAKRWNYDYVALHGIAMVLANDIENIKYYHRFFNRTKCYPKEERSRFNKIALLQMALFHRDTYDSILILDADATNMMSF